MIETNTLSQHAASAANRDVYLEKLYSLICKRVKCSFIVRRLATVDDVAGDVFLLLAERELPPFESEEFKKLLTKTVNRFVRRIKRSVREMLDVDELGESEHPFYETDFHTEDENFELVFNKFCEMFPEPKRTVFIKSRVLTKENIAEITGLTRRKVAQIIQLMPKYFEAFYENFSSESTSGKKIAH